MRLYLARQGEGYYPWRLPLLWTGRRNNPTCFMLYPNLRTRMLPLLLFSVLFLWHCDSSTPSDEQPPAGDEVVVTDDTNDPPSDDSNPPPTDDDTPPPADNPTPPDNNTPRFTNMTGSHLPAATRTSPAMDAKPADLDGDGDLDLVVANEFGPNLLLLNDGTGQFVDASNQIPRAVHDSEDVGIADFDNDGDLDIVLVSEDDQTNELYLNDGNARFSDGGSRLPVRGTSNGVFVADVNNDDHPDILIGNAGRNVVLINDGSGHFIDESDQRLPNHTTTTQDLELGDVDGDGDADLLVGNEGPNRLLLNDGTGVFTDAPAGSLPFPAGGEETREADFGDVDGDGDLDIFFANVGWSGINAQNRLLLNDGTGRFTDVTSTHFPSLNDTTLDGDFLDIDEDGDLDLVTASVTLGASQLLDAPYRVYLNDGTGRYTDETETIFPEGVTGRGLDVEAADFNGDGHLDMYLSNRQGSDLLLFMRE